MWSVVLECEPLTVGPVGGRKGVRGAGRYPQERVSSSVRGSWPRLPGPKVTEPKQGEFGLEHRIPHQVVDWGQVHWDQSRKMGHLRDLTNLPKCCLLLRTVHKKARVLMWGGCFHLVLDKDIVVFSEIRDSNQQHCINSAVIFIYVSICLHWVLVVAHGFNFCCSMKGLWLQRLGSSSLTTHQTQTPCTGETLSLSHWSTREVTQGWFLDRTGIQMNLSPVGPYW